MDVKYSSQNMTKCKFLARNDEIYIHDENMKYIFMRKHEIHFHEKT
jgi:hypothetical protein